METELVHLKIENANLKSRLEDLEERIEYYKKRIKKTELSSMPFVPIMSNPYEMSEANSARDSKPIEEQSSSKCKFCTFRHMFLKILTYSEKGIQS